MCGTGPYMLQSWDIGSSIHMARFNDYWDGVPELENVYIVTVNDVYDRIQMLQDGIADSAYIPIEYEHLFESDDYRIVKGIPTFNMMFAGFNLDINTEAAAVYGSDVPSDFFHDTHVRRAFTHLMDYNQFLESVLDGNGIQPNGAIPKSMFGYDEDVPKYEHSLELAQQELELAINEDTGNSWYEDGFEIALIYNAGNIYRQTACELMEDALEDLGSQFTVNVVALDWPTFLNELRKAPAPFPMFWLGWASDYADPDNYMTPFLDSVFGIYPYSTGYSNTAIDDIIREAAAELDPDTRADLYSEASMLVYEDAPYIWMYQANNFHVERSWVTGYYFHPMLHGLDYAALGKSSTPVNTPPVASFAVAPDSGSTSTMFWFDASSSYDLEDPVELLRVQWDWDGDGVWDTPLSTDKVAEHQYGVEGVYLVFLRVVDTDGLEGQTVRTVNVYAPGTCVPITDGTSVTIYEQSGEVYAHTFTVQELITTGASFSTIAKLYETYYISVLNGEHLVIECYREPPYPTTGTGTGNNIVAVRLDGVAGHADGLWATVMVSYVTGTGGIAESRWNALGPADQIGPYGDSLCTYLGDYYSNIVVGWSVEEVAISATVDFAKDKINLAAKGGWITVYIELPEGYDVADIDITTVCVEGTVFADLTDWSIGDYDKDGIADLMVRFEREDLSSVLQTGDEVAVTVSGALSDGTPFEGSEVLEVVDSKTEVVIAAILGATLGSINLGVLTVVAIALAAIAAIGLTGRVIDGRLRGVHRPMQTP